MAQPYLSLILMFWSVCGSYMNLISCRWRIGGKVRNLTPFSASCGTKKKRNHHVYRSILYMITYHSQIFFIKMVFCSSNNGQCRSRSQSVHFFFLSQKIKIFHAVAPDGYLRFQQARCRQPCPRAWRMSTMKSAHLLRSRFEQRRDVPPPITERRTWRVQRRRLESGGAFFSPPRSGVTQTWWTQRTSSLGSSRVNVTDFRGCRRWSRSGIYVKTCTDFPTWKVK